MAGFMCGQNYNYILSFFVIQRHPIEMFEKVSSFLLKYTILSVLSIRVLFGTVLLT